jgi:membrane associated rhomboid family serine protease
MSKRQQAGKINRYVPIGAVSGLFVGLVVYAITQYVPALGFGVLFGVVAAIFVASSQKR